MASRLWHPHVRLAFIHDVMMAALAYPFAFWLRLPHEFPQRFFHDHAFWVSWLVFIMVSAIVIYFSNMHRGYWRYASLRDIGVIIQSSFFITLGFLFASFLATRLEALPRSLPVILWVMLILSWTIPRLTYRSWRDGEGYFKRVFKQDFATKRIPAFIFGAVNEIEPFIRMALQRHDYPYDIVGIISSKDERTGRILHGIPILGNVASVARIFDEKGFKPMPQALIFAVSNQGRAMNHYQAIMDLAGKLNLSVSRIPAYGDLKHGIDDPLLQLQSVPMEELLGRPQRKLDKALLSHMISNKTILITGAGGSIGSEICRQVSKYQPNRLLLLDHSEYALYLIELELRELKIDCMIIPILGNVCDENAMEKLFLDHKPQVIFHAAAYKHVPLVETNPLEGMRNNILGTKIISSMAKAHHAQLMVQISTDKSVRPTSIMGAAKRIAEHILQLSDAQREKQHDTRYAIVRFGNVLGSTGSVIPLFERQLRKGGPLTVTDKSVTRYFMTIQEAVQLVLSAGATALQDTTTMGGIFILNMGEPVKIDDLARRMIRLAGYTPDEDIKITYTGLREGEKLYEELHYQDEEMTGNNKDGFTIAHPSLLNRKIFEQSLQSLETAIQNNDEKAAKAILQDLVPFYGDKIGHDQ